MTFTVLDRDAFSGIKQRREAGVFRSGFNTSGDYKGQDVQPAHLDHQMTMAENMERWSVMSSAHYTDEIPPLILCA